MSSLLRSAESLAPELCRLRRDLHRQPETGLHLPLTQKRVLQQLEGLALNVSTGRALSSVVAVIEGGLPGRTVLLRADMDALPVEERTGLEFASRNGAMHACGHDLHTSMLVGAAHLLADRRAELAGRVVLAFQPGEEGAGGAELMLREGLLDTTQERPEAAYALHVTSALLPSGLVATRPGPLMAAIDRLAVRVVGRGGHGSTPHLCADPVPAACEMVTALQALVTRTVDVFDPVVISVGTLRAGSAFNVIAEDVSFEASIRTFSPERRAALHGHVRRLLEGIAAAHGLEVEVGLEQLYDITRNAPDAVVRARRVVDGVLGDGHWVDLPTPVPASEDFSAMLDQVPGAMLLLGAVPPGRDPFTAPSNHAPDADFDEGVLPAGAALLAGLALNHLSPVGSG